MRSRNQRVCGCRAVGKVHGDRVPERADGGHGTYNRLDVLPERLDLFVAPAHSISIESLDSPPREIGDLLRRQVLPCAWPQARGPDRGLVDGADVGIVQPEVQVRRPSDRDDRS